MSDLNLQYSFTSRCHIFPSLSLPALEGILWLLCKLHTPLYTIPHYLHAHSTIHNAPNNVHAHSTTDPHTYNIHTQPSCALHHTAFRLEDFSHSPTRPKHMTEDEGKYACENCSSSNTFITISVFLRCASCCQVPGRQGACDGAQLFWARIYPN